MQAVPAVTRQILNMLSCAERALARSAEQPLPSVQACTVWPVAKYRVMHTV